MRNRMSKLIIGLILAICVIFPMLTQGIMCNDEVQLRLSAQMGIGHFFENYFVTECLEKGRMLGAIGNMKFLGYIFENRYIYRSVDIIFLLAGISLFGYVIYLLFKNVKFSIFVSIMILVFLPITFEHSLPNAFVILTMQPLILLEVSIISYIKYIEQENIRALIGCVFLFLWAMCLYEFIIVYVLLYPIIYCIKNINRIKIKEIIKLHIPLFLCALVYLMLYFGQRLVFPTTYSGNEIGVLSWKQMYPVIKTLFLSALPGYYCLGNSKYKYLFLVYNNGELGVKNYLNPIIWIFCICLIFILVELCHVQKIEHVSLVQRLLIYFSAIFFAIVPAVPNSIAKLYQGNVTAESFTSLPVSIYIYISIMFGLSFFLWNFVLKKGQRYLWLFISAIILIGASLVQVDNNVFAQEQSRNYIRFTSTERLFDLTFWTDYQEKRFSAPTLYETRNALAVEDGHWTEYLNKNGLSVSIENNCDNVSDWIVQQDDDSYLVSVDSNIIYISQNSNKEIVLARDLDGNYNLYQTTSVIGEENQQYIYQLVKK